MEPTTKPRSVVRAVLFFWGCLIVYHVNGRPHAGHDTVAPYTAWAVVRHGSLDLQHYADLRAFVGTAVYACRMDDGSTSVRKAPLSPMSRSSRHWRRSAKNRLAKTAMHHLGKLAAAFHLAAAAVRFYLLCRRFVPDGAWPATILFAFGTCPKERRQPSDLAARSRDLLADALANICSPTS